MANCEEDGHLWGSTGVCVMCGEPRFGEPNNDAGVDTSLRLPDDVAAAISEDDGLLLIRFTRNGVVPHVLRMGLMTEGRLEAGIMPIYMEINKARVRLANEARIKERTNAA